MERTAEKEDYRVPLMISKSVNPLFIKVGISQKFPQIPPTVQIMHKVTHEKFDPATYAYQSDLLRNWGAHSNMLTLIRQLNSELEVNAPINEASANDGASQGHHQEEVRVVEEPEEPANVLEAPDVRSEEQRITEV